MFLSIAYSASQFLSCFLISHAATGRCRLAWPRNTLFLVAADFAMPEIHYFWLSQTLQCPKYTISGRRRFCNARNTLFPAAADLHGSEIHYFRPPQVLQRPKYTISDCRRLAWIRNTLFLAAASFATPEIHYFGPPQTCMASKYTISAPPVSPRNGKAATRHGVGAVAFQRKW